MKLNINLTNLPKSLKVDVQKGQTGALIAEVNELGITTEANDPFELLININDLIYTYYDIPKKYQDKIQFVPTISTREVLTKTASKKYNLKIIPYYTEDLHRNIIAT